MPEKTITIKEDQALLVAKNAFHILSKYYEAEGKYHTLFGYDNKKNYLYWKEKAKDFLLNPTMDIVFKEKSEIILEKS